MLSLFIGGEKKAKDPHEELKRGQRLQHAKDMFYTGKFPVVTTPSIRGRRIKRVLGLVHGRGYEGEFALLALASAALEIGADAIVGYQEVVAFHPDGSKFFSCYGTAVITEKSQPGKTLKRSVTH